LFKLCVAKAGNVAEELNEPVFQHFLTSLVKEARKLVDAHVSFAPTERVEPGPQERKVIGPFVLDTAG
jgi:hypothetical protein